jgi:hypothetical protein
LFRNRLVHVDFAALMNLQWKRVPSAA